MKITWAQVIAVVSGLAGVAGAIVTPLYGSALAGEVKAVLEAVSGILVIVAGTHATIFGLRQGEVVGAARGRHDPAGAPASEQAHVGCRRIVPRLSTGRTPGQTTTAATSSTTPCRTESPLRRTSRT